jgi:hypothetical protein
MDLLDSEWSDYNDYQKKYGASVNKDFYSKRFEVFEFLEGLGYLLHQGLIDIESVYFLMQIGTELQWQKWKPIIYEERKRLDNPDWWIWFEHLANATVKFREKRGISSVTRIS